MPARTEEKEKEEINQVIKSGGREGKQKTREKAIILCKTFQMKKLLLHLFFLRFLQLHSY